MNDSVDDLLYPTEFGAVLGVGERQVRKVLGELEALGFSLGVAGWCAPLPATPGGGCEGRTGAR